MIEKPKPPPRVTVEVEEDLKDYLDQQLRYGELKLVVNTFLLALADKIQRYGRDVVIAGFLTGDFPFTDIVSSHCKSRREANGNDPHT